ncbi:MAG: O-methyltransferase [Sphingobacteriales bacterium]|uniref:O-methyltransferase n=1 Tax=Hydrotalea flava TaxID=714549 RepID=UPI000833AB15|nr:O-methyltransferase [Hydrotalea flava]RTL56803.1 MAG: O-methyltransferase [Sphingobacteriales bacterium]
MEFLNIEVEKYAEKFTSVQNEHLQRIYAQTNELHPHAHMMSNSVQGQLLSFLSNIIRPKYVLEIGTFTGYSALCLAEGLTKDGELHTLELRAEDATTAQQNFSKSPLAKQIHLHIGNALDIIPTLPFEWDLVFIDADKTGYIKYYELVLPKLKKNGVIIADNVLFHGQVLEEPIKGKNAIAIHAFNEWVANDVRTHQVLLTVRDGLLLIKKR